MKQRMASNSSSYSSTLTTTTTENQNQNHNSNTINHIGGIHHNNNTTTKSATFSSLQKVHHPLLDNQTSRASTAATSITTSSSTGTTAIEQRQDSSCSSSSSNNNNNKMSSLDQALEAIAGHNWTDLHNLLEQEPGLARQQVPMVLQGENSHGLFVHYLLCCPQAKDIPVATMDAFVTLYPASLLQPEPRGQRLPIHIAVDKGASPEIVKYLCQARPQALHIKDSDGNLPLHGAAMYGSPTVLHYILTSYPEGATVANARDRFPLHLVCARCYDDTIPISIQDIEAMIQAYPHALTQLDRFHRTPLHLAVNVQHPQYQILQVLIAHAPQALLFKDKSRTTPYQRAARNASTSTSTIATNANTVPSNNNKNTTTGNKGKNDLVVTALLEATRRERKAQGKHGWRRLYSSGNNNGGSCSSSVSAGTGNRSGRSTNGVFSMMFPSSASESASASASVSVCSSHRSTATSSSMRSYTLPSPSTSVTSLTRRIRRRSKNHKLLPSSTTQQQQDDDDDDDENDEDLYCCYG